MTALMRDVYDQFLDKALQGRQKAGKSLTHDQLVKLAGGRVWTGRQARENGLVDEVGGLDDAIAAARKMANMPADKEPELLLLPKSKSFLDALLDKGSDSRFPGMDLGALRLLRTLPGGAGKLATVETLLQLRTEPVWMMLPYQLELR
jgi:protease-4